MLIGWGFLSQESVNSEAKAIKKNAKFKLLGERFFHLREIFMRR